MTFDPAVFKHLYPFESHALDRSGLRYHYVDEGAGDPLILVHGNPSWSFYYRNLILALRDSHRVIAPDHIGCGLSDKPGDDRYDYRLKSRIDDLEALIDHLELNDNLTLILHDWGGAIGMGFATRHPDRIRRLVLMNTAAFFSPGDKPIPWQLKVARNPLLGSILVRGCNAFARGSAARWATASGFSPEVRRAYLAPYDSWANRIATLRFVQDIPLAPGEPSYETIEEIQSALHQFEEIPTLICWGERDFVFDLDFLAEWNRRLPKAEVHRFPRAGHYVLEDAGGEIIPLVGRFLEANSLAEKPA